MVWCFCKYGDSIVLDDYDCEVSKLEISFDSLKSKKPRLHEEDLDKGFYDRISDDEDSFPMSFYYNSLLFFSILRNCKIGQMGSCLCYDEIDNKGFFTNIPTSITDQSNCTETKWRRNHNVNLDDMELFLERASRISRIPQEISLPYESVSSYVPDFIQGTKKYYTDFVKMIDWIDLCNHVVAVFKGGFIRQVKRMGIEEKIQIDDMTQLLKKLRNINH